ncbi:nuclease HARBI1 [Trichonephila clavipes]|nr:nuclease HARBI1 [Trichonephila clavipes]
MLGVGGRNSDSSQSIQITEFIQNYRVSRVPAIVAASCVLHNLCTCMDDPKPPAEYQIEVLVQQLQLENEDVTLSFETRPRCPAGFAKRNVGVANFFSN